MPRTLTASLASMALALTACATRVEPTDVSSRDATSTDRGVPLDTRLTDIATCSLDGRATFERAPSAPTEICSSDVEVTQVFLSIGPPMTCTLIPNYAQAVIDLGGGDSIGLSGDGRFFAQTGTAMGRVGLVTDCGPIAGRCRYAGDCPITVIRAGSVGDVIETSVETDCTLTDAGHPEAGAVVLHSLHITGTMGQRVQPTNIGDASYDTAGCGSGG